MICALAVDDLPVSICDSLFRHPAIRDSVMISVALLELAVAKHFCPQSSLNRFVLVFDELAEHQWVDFSGKFCRVNFNLPLRCSSVNAPVAVEKKDRSTSNRRYC